MTEWHSMKKENVLKDLQSSASGLKDSEAQTRIGQYGYNELQEKKKTPEWILFLNQFKDLLVVILIIAAIVSAFLGEILDAAAIIIIVILNAILGFVQERRAEKALEALKKFASPRAQVIRDNETKIIDTRELVPGDVIVLNVGDRVPADSRLLETFNLKVDESVLTGESVPVEKTPEESKPEAAVAERHSMLFSGTTIVYGHCNAVVVETGMKTEFGKIASALQEEGETQTPLQEKLEVFGSILD